MRNYLDAFYGNTEALNEILGVVADARVAALKLRELGYVREAVTVEELTERIVEELQ